MNKKFSKLYAIASIFIGIFISSTPITANADWVITNLGSLGGSHSWPTGINDSGQVVGFSTVRPDNRYGWIYHAFITGPNGVGMTDLGTLGGQFSDASDINNSGQVVGYSTVGPDDWDSHAFITGPNGVGMMDLGTFGGSNNVCVATDINDSGQVTGYSAGFSGPFITGPNGVGMTDLGTLGGQYTNVYDMNNLGQVVGASTDSDGVYQAFITGPNGVGMTALGTLGGSSSEAVAVNNSGQVVGYFTDAAGFIQPFITGPNGIGITALGNWEVRINSLDTWVGYGQAYDINDKGQVVGGYMADDGYWHAFLYSEGLYTDLSLLPSVVATGWTEFRELSINNNGQIVGSADLSGFWGHQTFMLSYVSEVNEPTETVPEPGTLLLVGLGLLGLTARRRSNIARLT